ncbi:MAG: hypothetical protein CSA81_07290 [Acidobacteria bacterium]|nr:MAG: hypothetical protein CSA81_07290 [Acidobacteriota bacterium]
MSSIENRFTELATQIKQEFLFDTCFFCDRTGMDLVLSQGDAASSFAVFLKTRLQEEDDSYFTEVKFFRYRNSELKTTEHLALIPVYLEGSNFKFLGIIYRKLEYLDKLLKSRVLPAYLTGWLYNLITERELAQKREENIQRLVLALEEKRQYTLTLESKLEDMQQKMEDIRVSSGGKKVELFALRELLEDQVKEYQNLAREYQALFEEFEHMEKEYLSICVTFETQTHLQNRRRSEDWTRELEKAIEEHEQTKQELLKVRTVAAHYQSKYNQILKNFSKWSPDMLRDFQKKVRLIGSKSNKR